MIKTEQDLKVKEIIRYLQEKLCFGNIVNAVLKLYSQKLYLSDLGHESRYLLIPLKDKLFDPHGVPCQAALAGLQALLCFCKLGHHELFLIDVRQTNVSGIF